MPVSQAPCSRCIRAFGAWVFGFFGVRVFSDFGGSILQSKKFLHHPSKGSIYEAVSLFSAGVATGGPPQKSRLSSLDLPEAELFFFAFAARPAEADIPKTSSSDPT